MRQKIHSRRRGHVRETARRRHPLTILTGLSITITATLAATALGASAQGQPAASIPPVIRQMIEQAQRELARGNPAAAADLFERAASHGEYADAEVGEVRARLWAGQFRHAVAISGVVAGEHPESAEAQALLGYIEDRNGYTGQALKRLRNEQQARPDEAAPVAAEAVILIERHSAGEAIELIDRWMAAHAPQSDLCGLRTRAALVESFEAGSTPPAGRQCEILAIRPAATAEESHSPETWRFPASLGAPLTAGNGIITDEGRRVLTLRGVVDAASASRHLSTSPRCR